MSYFYEKNTNPTIGTTVGLKSLVPRYSLSSEGINIFINGFSKFSYNNYNIIYLYSVIVLGSFLTMSG